MEMKVKVGPTEELEILKTETCRVQAPTQSTTTKFKKLTQKVYLTFLHSEC